MKTHRNVAFGIVNGLHQILEKNQSPRPYLNKILKQNKKWGSRDRRQISEAILDCIRWKRTYEYLGSFTEKSNNYYWELLGIWLLNKGLIFPNWDELSRLKDLKIFLPLNPKIIERKIRESIPDWLDEFGVKYFDETTWEKEIHALNSKAPLVLRCNTLKQNPLKLQNYLKRDFKIDSYRHDEIPEALIIKKHQKLNQNPLYLKGFFEIQDANSQRVARWIDPQKGNLIVDSCAGSGGKSLHLAALMKNKGKIFALDTRPKKLDQLNKRASRNGVFNIQTLMTDNTEFYIKYRGVIDAVLIDAPCSGLGVIKRNPAAKWQINPEKIGVYEKLQKKILLKNSTLVKKGGILVYATCTIFPNENQHQISNFLKSKEGKNFILVKDQTYLANETGFDGFYIAKLKKT